MNQLEMPLEMALRKEAVTRMLVELYDTEDFLGPMEAARILNEAWFQEQVVTRWLAKEAAENLAEAYEANRFNSTRDLL